MADWLVHNGRRMLAWFKDDIFRRLLHNAGWLLSGTVMASALTLGSTVIKARSLGPKLFGVLAVVLAYVAVVERIAAFQPWLALIKYGAEARQRKRPDQLMGLVKMSICLDLLGAVSGTIIAVLGAYALAGWKGWDSQMSLMAVVLSLSILFNLSGTPTGVLRLLDRFRISAAEKVLSAGLALVGSIVVWLAGWGLWGFLIVTLVSGIVGDLFLLGASLIVLRQAGVLKHWQAPAAECKPFLRFVGWTYAMATLDIPVKQLDVLIVSSVASFEATGIYKIIKQSCVLLTGMAEPLYQAVYPQFADMIAGLDYRKATKYAAKVGIMTAAVLGPIAILLAAFSPWWLPMLLGSDYKAGWLPLVAFLGVTVLSVLCMAIHPLFTAMGYVKENVVVLLVANSVYLPCAWLLTREKGLLGLAVATGIQLVLVVGLKAAYIHRGWACHERVASPVAEVQA
jgi:O-antigen/teichoic acid export membrane protein